MSVPLPPVKTNPTDTPLELASAPAGQSLKRRSVRGAASTGLGQAVKFVTRFGTTAVLARLLSPEDFGLVAMTIVITGFVSMFADAGLSTATIQREKITQGQISTLFWINVLLGVGIAGFTAAISGLIALFYGEPRLQAISIALAVTFVLGGLSIQHQALLRRQMRFTTLALIEVGSMVIGAVVGIVMALLGFGYWSLVGMPIGTVFATLIMVWIAVPWRPGFAHNLREAKPLLSFGGDILTFNVVNYFSRQADTLLIGWYWGAVSLGFYDKAYTMLLLPIKQINGPLAAVAIPTLSRARVDPAQFRRFFLSCVQMVASACIPMVLGIALFADELVLLWLGPKWMESADLFRLLAVAAAVGAVNNPVGWLLISTGQTRRFRRLGIFNSLIIVSAFAIGLRHGASGVALSYSIVMALLMVPMWWYTLRETDIRLRHVAASLAPPVLSCVPAALAVLAARQLELPWAPSWLPLVIGGAAFGAVYAAVLLFGFRRWSFFKSIVAQLRPRATPPAPPSAP
jgi:O-antigen/teichoic acid export membrane protein